MTCSHASPFHLQLRAPCRLKLVWDIGGMILTVKALSSRSKTCPIANLCTTHFTVTDLGSRLEAGDWPSDPRHGQPFSLNWRNWNNISNSVSTPPRTQSCSITTGNHSMTFRDTNDVCLQNHWKYIKTLCGKTTEHINVSVGGTQNIGL